MENPTECLPHPQALLKDRDTPQGKRSDILSKGKISKSIITHIRVNQIILKKKKKELETPLTWGAVTVLYSLTIKPF